MSNVDAEVLVVGAGPTGLALAAQLVASGTRARVIDRNRDRAHESRALAIQPRTLEVMAGLGVSDELVRLGNPNVRLRLHARGRELSMPLFDLGLADSAYPYLLFLSQAETERVLVEHLAVRGVAVERNVELIGMGEHGDRVDCRLRHSDGREDELRVRYVVGCDGAHSTVRELAGIPFQGGSYPQTFVLADLDADGLQPGTAHVFLSAQGMLLFFPLVQPAPWRLLVARGRRDPAAPGADVTLTEVQDLADAYTGGSVRLRDPVWMTNFRLHHRAATRYRAGRAFLAGDAAHIHSPAGGQGMNTGIQDAVNLGWKLAGVLHGADPRLLDTYEIERAPIGRAVLRMSDRAFTIATATSAAAAFARTRLAPALLRMALRARTGRAYVFRMLAELGIRYRNSPLSVDGPGTNHRGPRPGDRLPDAVVIHNGVPTTLHAALVPPGWCLLLCDPDGSGRQDAARVAEGYPDLLAHHLTRHDAAGVLHDPDGTALRRLGVAGAGIQMLLVRPDGHIGYRAGATDYEGLAEYLRRWLSRSSRA